LPVRLFIFLTRYFLFAMPTRRFLLKTLPFLPLFNASAAMYDFSNKKIIKPPRLQAGHTVALIAPSGPVSDGMIERATEALTAMNFKVKLGLHIREKYGYLAGSDAQRAEDFNRAFADPEVDAVFAIRGGYGGMRILPLLDYRLLRRHPKIFIGYSDITAFHTALHQRTGLVTFHGPVSAMAYTDYTRPYVWHALTQTEGQILRNAPENLENPSNLFRPEAITPGRCRGRLIGGNLTLLAAMAGTPYALRDVRGRILLLEDIEERPYRVDRMLTQLMQSVDLRMCAGIACGIFEGCNPKEGESSLSLIDCLRDRLGGLGIPVFYGFSFGHISHQFTLPIGVEAEMDTDAQTITLLEGGVV
jgi:muramoyltetrapeptide carboxypeptidase